jgi:hypothetical protein
MVTSLAHKVFQCYHLEVLKRFIMSSGNYQSFFLFLILGGTCPLCPPTYATDPYFSLFNADTRNAEHATPNADTRNAERATKFAGTPANLAARSNA